MKKMFALGCLFMFVLLAVSIYIYEYIIINNTVMSIVYEANNINKKNTMTNIISDDLYNSVKAFDKPLLDEYIKQYGEENIVLDLNIERKISLHSFICGKTRYSYYYNISTKNGKHLDGAGTKEERIDCYIKWQFDVNGLKIIGFFETP